MSPQSGNKVMQGWLNRSNELNELSNLVGIYFAISRPLLSSNYKEL